MRMIYYLCTDVVYIKETDVHYSGHPHVLYSLTFTVYLFDMAIGFRSPNVVPGSLSLFAFHTGD